MKHMAYMLVVVVTCLCGMNCTLEKQPDEAAVPLGESLDAWGWYLADANVAKEDVWSIEDGVLICKGTPLGYLYTKEDYGNFRLTLEWRWPPGAEPGKGGVLIRTTGEQKIWPRSLEAQINVGDAGDFWGLAGYALSGPPDRTRSLDHETYGRLINVKKTTSLEKPAGQWNSYEIIADGGTVTLIINGDEVNRAEGCDLTPGKICLTSEGNEIHFRNVTLRRKT
jgi:hypothetical protein